MHGEEWATYDATPRPSRANFGDAPDLVGCRGRRVVAASRPRPPRRSRRPRPRAARRRAVLATHFWYLTAIAALLWLPLAVLELTGVAHGIEIDTDHFHLGDVALNVVIVLVFELLVAELLAAASEKIVASDLHGDRAAVTPRVPRNRCRGSRCCSARSSTRSASASGSCSS